MSAHIRSAREGHSMLVLVDMKFESWENTCVFMQELAAGFIIPIWVMSSYFFIPDYVMLPLADEFLAGIAAPTFYNVLRYESGVNVHHMICFLPFMRQALPPYEIPSILYRVPM